MQYLTLPLSHYSLPRLYSVLRSDNSSALPSSTPTGTPDSKLNVVPLAVGLTLGLLTLVIVVLGAFYLERRRRRKSAERARRRKSDLLDTRVTPLYLTSPAQGDQLSGVPQESKPRFQPLTHGSSGAPTATVIPTISAGIPELGMAPSYDTREVRESGPA